LTRPRIKDKYELASDEIEVTRKVIEQKSILEIPAQVEFKLRDPHDNYLVGLAVAGQADCIVTRDGDLLGDNALPNFLDKNRIRVMSVQRFLDFLDEQAN
jgi:predicted nucleic acid-binding protein